MLLLALDLEFAEGCELVTQGLVLAPSCSPHGARNDATRKEWGQHLHCQEGQATSEQRSCLFLLLAEPGEGFLAGATLPAQPGTLEPTPLTWLARGESGCWRGAPGPPGAVTPRGWGGPRGG